MKVLITPTTPVPKELKLPALVKITDSNDTVYYGIASEVVSYADSRQSKVRLCLLHYENTNPKLQYDLYRLEWYYFNTIELLPPDQQIILSN